VRLRTTAAATAVVILTLAVGSLILLVTLERGLRRSQDETARARAEDVAAAFATSPAHTVLPASGDDGFIQVVDRSGTVVASTPNVRGREAAFSFRPPDGGPRVRDVRGVRDDRDLEDYRVWALRASSPAGSVTVYVATSLELVSQAVSTLRGLLLGGVPVVAVLLAGLTWLLLGRALRPVESIRAEVATISDAELGRRVPEPPGDDEIARLARTMNGMLSRLELASRRQRAFAADASHELQSPLTTFRTQLEVALSRPASADWPRVAGELLHDSQEMERMVRDLLFLARDDELSDAERPADLVDLDSVVLEEAARLRTSTALTVDTTGVSAAPVRGSREQLGRLTRNLLENAVRHAATRVVLQLATCDGTVEMTVHDDGPGVPPDARQRIFDRFVRLDDARSRHAAGGGLGLSIVAAIAFRHGGTVSVGDSTSGATFVLRLPTPTTKF
jgi:signal transduction histidine kinase